MSNLEVPPQLSLDILPEPQRLLWAELKATPSQFVLYGGTAIALQVGHRQSNDFDFFAFCPIDPQQLLRDVPYLQNATVTQSAVNTLTATVYRGGSVQVSFFGLPRLHHVEEAITVAIDTGSIKIASFLDLAGTKMSAVQQRAELRDYIDIDVLITKCGVSLPAALTAAKIIYGAQFNPQITLKALSYFEEPNLLCLPDEIKRRLTAAVREVDLDHLPQPGVLQKE